MTTTVFQNVLFLSGSSGATTKRTMAQRTADGVINVKDYGAIGNGIADDTAAIQAAIDWTGSNTYAGVIFLPYGQYIVTAPLNWGSDITNSIVFCGVGEGSEIISSLAGQAVLNRAAGPTNNTSILVIEKMRITNNGVLGCAVLLGASSLGASIRDCFIHADIGISCGEFVNPTQVTSAPTASGSTLTFAAGVPQRVIDNVNNAHGQAIAVANVTTPGSISGGTSVSAATSTTITLSAPVAGTVGSGDTIQFTWTQQESVRGAWQVVVDRVHLEAHHDYIPGSFGIAIIENSVINSVDMNTYDHGIRVCGVGNVITAPHIETCRKAIVLGIMPNGVLQTGSSFAITGLGAESNGAAIDCVSSFGTGVIQSSGQNAANFAVPYTGNVPVSSVSVTGSNSSATGTAHVEYNMTRNQYEMTLTAVTGTFQIGDTVGDGTNIPSFTRIGSFVSGSGGSGTVCGSLSGNAEYGFHFGSLLGSVEVSGCANTAFYNQAAFDFDGGGNGSANVTFTSCFASNNVPGRPGWITPSIAGDAKYINCNLDQPQYAFNNLRQYPYVQFGDEFFVNDSSVAASGNFGVTVANGGSNGVRALASKIVTGVTNLGTPIGSPTIHFASTPSGIVNGMVIGSSGRITTGLQPFPVGATVISQTGTSVTASANATAAITSGDTIGFVQWTVSGA